MCEREREKGFEQVRECVYMCVREREREREQRERERERERERDGLAAWRTAPRKLLIKR